MTNLRLMDDELVEDSRSALDRVVDTARRMEEHEEVDRWQFADDVHEAVDDVQRENRFPVRPGGGRTGLYGAIDVVNDRLREEKVASLGRKAVVAAYTTAVAWPEELRVEGANYWAHYELRARQYDNRRHGILSGLVQKSDGPIGTPRVRLWKSDQKHDPVVSFLEQVERGVRGFLKRKGNPWNRVGMDDREAIARVLRTIANEIERDEFGA